MSGEPRALILNDLAYSNGELDPLRAIHDCIVFSADDWGASRAMSWVYGIVCGWDDPDGVEEDGAMAEQAARWGWDAASVDRLRRLHAAYAEAEPARPLPGGDG